MLKRMQEGAEYVEEQCWVDSSLRGIILREGGGEVTLSSPKSVRYFRREESQKE
jgi:hypothetical protein